MSLISKLSSSINLKNIFTLTKRSTIPEKTIANQVMVTKDSKVLEPFCQTYWKSLQHSSNKIRRPSVEYHNYLNGINHYLTGNGDLSGLKEPIFGLGLSPDKIIKITDTEFKFLPKTKESIIAYRCIGEKPEFFKSDYARYSKSLNVKKGDIVTMPEYAYSTSDIDYAKVYLPNNKGIIYEIEYPAGSKISITGSGINNEITAPRCSKYECLDVLQQQDVTTIKLRYLQPIDFVS